MNIEFDSRLQLPQVLNQLGLHGLGVEVGVQRGVNAAHILRHWRGECLYLVDPWAPYPGGEQDPQVHEVYYNDALNAVAEVMRGHAQCRSYEIMRLEWLDACAELHRRGRQLDWVYLDGDHEYDSVARDIAIAWPLIKPGGVLAGHDYIADGWHRNGDPYTAYTTEAEAQLERGHCGPFGVMRAVNEFVTLTKLAPPLTTLGTTDGGWRSWLVQKT